MFELSDNLIGIYKTYNCTKSVTIDPRLFDNNEKPLEKVNEFENARVNNCNDKNNVNEEDKETTQSESNIDESELSDNMEGDRVIEDSFPEEQMEVD